jgi:ATP-binding cassette, subfamily F, member 3
MQPIATHSEEGAIAFAFPDPDPVPPPLVSLDRVSVGYGDRPVLKNLSLRLDADDRVALLGANGNGKSTLIKLLAGRLSPLSGDIVRSGKLRVGYFAQHQADELDVAATPLVQLARLRPRDPEVELRGHLGRFGFSQQRADVRIGSLSGGEKARLLFALMTAERPHILLLDEPTNHLDVTSRQALIEALNEYRGAVAIVSHDPHVLELTADRFWLIGDSGVTPFDGDMQDYRARLLSRENLTAGKAAANGGGRERPRKKERRRLAEERRQMLTPLKKQLAQAEDAVDRLESEKAELMQALADPQLYMGDSRRLAEMQKRLTQVQKRLDLAETAWIGAQEAWDQAQADPP